MKKNLTELVMILDRSGSMSGLESDTIGGYNGMLQKQRDCRLLGTIIMEGRDICTVVLPDATAKFFITATPEERARRRFAQSGEIAPGATIQSVAAEIAERDRQDENRPIAPLKPAPDATVIFTDGMTPEQVTDKVIAVFKEKAQL